MAYKEPGAYLRLVTSNKYATGTAPTLIPLIIGGGAQILKRTDVITRANTGDKDLLPREAEKILSIGVTSRKPTFTEKKGVDNTGDYTFATGTNEIMWDNTTENKPAAGDNYYVTYTYKVGDEQYEPKLVFSDDDIERYYGPEFKENEIDPETGAAPINRLSLAAKIAREAGASVLYVQQVKPSDVGKVTAVEYKEALDKYTAFLNDVWRIVPVDLSTDVNSAIDAHIEAMSSYEERKERSAIYGTPQSSPVLDFNTVYQTVGGYAESKKYKRITTFYPDHATKLLSDGNFYDLDAVFLAAAYAGREAFLPVSQSKTRDSITVFDSLKGVEMLRKEMNMLAEKGVMIFTQPYGAGTDIIIRHQLTTDMSSPQTRENSVVMIADYCSKYLRSVCEQYIGKYNVTGETIARINASLDGALYNLKKDGVITAGSVQSIMQDEYNPDTLLISCMIKPPYPCNYIEITLFVE